MTSDTSSRPIERRMLTNQVYERILESIMSGELAGGQRIGMEAMARAFGVSATPVREALIALEKTRLVEREALNGFRVSEPASREELTQLLDARLMLEVTATALAEPHTEELLPALLDAQRRHRQASERVLSELRRSEASRVAVAADFYTSDREFHDVIFVAARNPYIREMYHGMGALLHRARQTVKRGVSDVYEAIEEHAAIVDAFESRQPGAPTEAMRTHIENVRVRSLADADREAGISPTDGA